MVVLVSSSWLSLYRMYPQIAAWPYSKYYTVDVSSHLSLARVKDLIPGFDWPNGQPIAFYNVERGQEERIDTSYRNLPEVKVIAQIVRGVLSHGVQSTNVAVISFYNEQKKALHAEFQKDQQLKSVRIDNVDAFQGLEYDLVILSLVRTNARNSVGFASKACRINVAVTRARFGLIVVGDGSFWYRSSYDLRSMLTHYRRQRCIVGSDINFTRPAASDTSSVARVPCSSLASKKQSLSSKLLKQVGAHIDDDSLSWHIAKVFEARTALTSHPQFARVLHYILMLEPHFYREFDVPNDILKWDRKAWSRYGAVHGFGINEDPGNGYYTPALIVLCFAFREVPGLWREQLKPYMAIQSQDDVCVLFEQSNKAWESYVNFAGDIFEGFAGILTLSMPDSRQWCSLQKLRVEDARVLNDLLSRYISQFKKVSHAFEAQLVGDDESMKSWSRWIEEANAYGARDVCVNADDVEDTLYYKSIFQKESSRSENPYGERSASVCSNGTLYGDRPCSDTARNMTGNVLSSQAARSSSSVYQDSSSSVSPAMDDFGASMLSSGGSSSLEVDVSSVELQQILAAEIIVPHAVKHAFNMFALVASQCDTLAETQAYLDLQNRINIEECEFMRKIVELVDSWDLTWEYISSYESFFRDHWQSLWREWILLIELKHTKVNELHRALLPTSDSNENVRCETKWKAKSPPPPPPPPGLEPMCSSSDWNESWQFKNWKTDTWWNGSEEHWNDNSEWGRSLGNSDPWQESSYGWSSSSSSKSTPQSYQDRRFEADKKKKWFICDRCAKRVDYKGQSIPFQGNFLHRNPPPQYERQPNFVWDMKAKEKAWRDGTWNATWLCTDCLISHHHCTKAYAFQSGLIGDFSKQRAWEKLHWQSRSS